MAPAVGSRGRPSTAGAVWAPASLTDTAAPLYADSLVECENLSMAPFYECHYRLPGPETLQGRFAWPERMWDLFTAVERDRLIHNLVHLQPSTHFSGLGSFEWIIAAITDEVNKHILHPIPSPRSVHVCDKEPTRQRVLSSFDPHHRPHHVFRDFTERLPAEDKEEFLAMVPGTHEPQITRRAKNEMARRYIFDVFKDRAEECATSFCVLHGKQCPCFSKAPSPWHSDDSESDNESETTLHLHGAGVICKDASSQGSMSGDGGQFMHLQHLWCAERIARQEDIILVECTPRWEPRTVMKHMPSKYHSHSAVLTTGMLGEQNRRDRRELAMYNSERVVCCSSYVNCGERVIRLFVCYSCVISLCLIQC